MDVSLSDLMRRRRHNWSGRSTVFAARLDQRCSFCLYSPPATGKSPSFRNLLVYVHGEGRRFQYLLNVLSPLAKSCNYVIVCPLFPANILRDGNVAGYKYLREKEIRYDEILIDMIAEVRAAYNFEEDRFLMGGFSGGGQFCHRFSYFHPEMLRAISVAAPGSVTLLADDVPWWVGTGSVDEVFGRDVDVEGLKNVELQLVVGELDNEEEEVGFGPTTRHWAPLANVAGLSRVERLKALHNSLTARGIVADLEIIPKGRHNFADLLPAIEQFFERFAVRTAPTGGTETSTPEH